MVRPFGFAQGERARHKQKESFGFVRAAVAVPKVYLGDVERNSEEILGLLAKAVKGGAALAVFPECSLTGYTLGDLFQQEALQKKALEGLGYLRDGTKTWKTVFCVGLPFSWEGKLFNAAAVVSGGKILGLVPKTYLPGYKEFYEERWFASARDLLGKEVYLFGEKVPIGGDLLFRVKENPDFVLGVEICEDLWAPIPVSSYAAIAGATVIANLSASNEWVGKSEYRKSLVVGQSARGICGYLYTSSGVYESTTDLVYSGHAMIAENGHLLAESERFSRASQIVFADLDLSALTHDRKNLTPFAESTHDLSSKNFRVVDFSLKTSSLEGLLRNVSPYPFVPSDSLEREKRAQEVFSIQTAGLAKRWEHSGAKNLIIGVSGGLDSTLALLVCVKTAQILGLPLKNVHAFSLPGFATSSRTRKNAQKLARSLGVTFSELDIKGGTSRQLKDLSHNGKTQDLTFENAQARYRTMTLMNKANQIGGLVVGTGDLSEIALGWNTYTGDHISHYNVNGSVPKTLVRHLVEWVSEQRDFSHVKGILSDILATPISPELSRNHARKITQKTEEILGPYELHDFFLYHFVRWGSSPKKILFLAEHAFGESYKEESLRRHLRTFLARFFQNQWKRSVMPDGPKVGSVVLSPRGDWRMPSDAQAREWLLELK